jgi:DNA modification methylase
MKMEVTGDATLINADVREGLRSLPDNSVHCVITSPPYWGLRDYGTATWEGGDAECDHRAPDEAGNTDKPTSGQRQHAGRFAGPNCHKCGARRIDSQLGLEPTPEAYVANMVAVFREVKRVLREDGTCWLNLGDSYAGGNYRGGGIDTASTKQVSNVGTTAFMAKAMPDIPPGLKPKDLVGIPWRVAFALQADGWWLRQDIIWHKPNPMPESVTDRCTKAHEYVFLLTKSARYFYDADAIREPVMDSSLKRAEYSGAAGTKWHDEQDTVGHTKGSGVKRRACLEHGPNNNPAGRNKRSVWTVATAPYSGAHFATFPPKLIEPMVLAGCPVGGTVLDPFAGSGTTGEVALGLSRKFIGIELSAEYFTDLLTHRIKTSQQQGRLFA